MKFTISLPPTTKKNSQQIIHIGPKCPECGRGDRAMPLPSKQFKRYEKQAAYYVPWDIGPIDKPVNVKAVYYMPTRRRVDLTNLHEALHDILVEYKVLSDDNCNIIVSTDGSRVRYDKENPRTEVEITEALDVDWQTCLKESDVP